MTEYTLKTKNVNNPHLLKKVSDFTGDLINNFDIIWNNDKQRDVILEVVDEFLEDLGNNASEIEQWNVICDGRNNKTKDIKNKVTHLDIYYRQRHCYNITVLNYTIKR